MAIGRKTGGRRPGSKNKRTRELEARVEAMLEGMDASAMMPLDVMLHVMRDSRLDVALRFEAARAAAPYVHPRLAAVEHTGAERGPIAMVVEGEGEMKITDLARRISAIIETAAARTDADPAEAGICGPPMP
jgi:hypothetical protein